MQGAVQVLWFLWDNAGAQVRSVRGAWYVKGKTICAANLHFSGARYLDVCDRRPLASVCLDNFV